ncbi:MAG TPA: ArgE/DapE family deacylase [Thermoplasmata archaeon]|nr:ArgE/DapE family deacylase [Thermoplasmata archaeon]
MLTAEERRVLAAIDDRRSELVDLLVHLLRFRTVTPLMGERASGPDYVNLQAFVAKRIAALGFRVETWDADAASLPRFPGSGVVPDRDLRDMPVLVGRREGRGRSLLLNAHYDVVPAGVLENWSQPPFEGVVADGKVFGRGACDMKGGFAAMLHALECIEAAGVDLPMPLLFESVPDEEQTSMGTLACCARGLRADAAIIPEPTDLHVLVAARGSFSGKIVVTGRAGHSEMAQPAWEQGGAVNAIDKAVEVLRGLEALNAEWKASPAKRHRYLDPDVIVPTMIRGGEWEVMYPERVEITFTSDFVPSTKDMRGQIQAALDRIAAADPWMREHPAVLDAGGWLYGGEVREDEAIVRTASAALADLGIPPQLIGCGSLTDMVHLVNYSHVPTVSIGPSVATIHKADEHATVDELVAVAKALAVTILRWGRAGV